MLPPKLVIDPPLLNTACPWATTDQELRALYSNPSTGAVTIRTSLLKGFPHDDSHHQFLFFSPSNPSVSKKPALQYHHAKGAGELLTSEEEKQTLKGSLNSLGYSPYSLSYYVDILLRLPPRIGPRGNKKPVIVSVTGSPADVNLCYDHIISSSASRSLPLAVEVNLSCPNIIDAPPPAYDQASLEKYLAALPDQPQIPIGLKTPPYTHEGQFRSLIQALKSAPGKISFLTATNTLGSCTILNPESNKAVLPGPGLGGMAGPSLHPLALGNVLTLARMLRSDGDLSHIGIIGVGGVSDREGFDRMRAKGAMAVGVATGLGREGVGVFDKILAGDVTKARL